MNILKTYFENLSFLHLSSNEPFSSELKAFNSGSNLPFCNRVFVDYKLNNSTLIKLQHYYKTLPFTIWIDAKNKDANEAANTLGLKLKCSYPLMKAKLDKLQLPCFDANIHTRELTSNLEILSSWVETVIKIYNITSLEEFQKYIKCLLKLNKDKVKFYFGYYGNEIAATSMLIHRENTLDLHWVGTLPNFRNKGLGSAISYFPLINIQQSNACAILYASEMGKPIYEKIGFSILADCNIYIL